ncbi:MAG TPA: right-handed parallel beta-helix repeat-containing protein [Candidatus Limnocylindria bacterium]|nr:right-handed parallel beta-helix repeat-containing protein [Candidatus Limnocylindria bacterium]
MESFVPYPGAVITRSVRLVPGVYDFTGREGIVIGADNVEVDGAGAVLLGGAAGFPGGELPEGAGDVPADNRYFGTGVLLRGRRGVTVRGLAVHGFDVGFRLESCERVTLESCDASRCFHDPDWGWDERGLHGGFLLEGCRECAVRACRANEVWDALHLRFCDDNLVEGNDFSHTSDTGLKLWRSCRNRFLRNDLSWGLRISPGEVHARDSSCVLVESGSDGNLFQNNDMTHGGDGFFIRVLNGWMSTGNVLIENDCSWANNNGIEAWADRNTYIRNTCSHCSYGFWLGDSDHTVLIGNEASHNGRDFRNAPETFGNAGIAFVNGSCSHAVIVGNDVHDNAGPGLAIRHAHDRPSLHALIAGNRFAGNQDRGTFAGHGVFLKHARLMFLRGNEFSGNAGEDVALGGNAAHLYEARPGAPDEAPEPVAVRLRPGLILAGRPVRMAADAGDGARVSWDFGDEGFAEGSEAEHAWEAPGAYALSVTAFRDGRIRLGGMVVHVLPGDFVSFAVGGAEASEGMVDDAEGVFGHPAPRAVWGKGAKRVLTLSGDMGAVADGSNLVIHLRYLGDHAPDGARQLEPPAVTLKFAAQGTMAEVKAEHLPQAKAPLSGQRERGHTLLYAFSWPEVGAGRHSLREVRLDFGESDASHSEVTVDAVGFAKAVTDEPQPADVVAPNLEEWIAAEQETGQITEVGGVTLTPLGDAPMRVRGALLRTPAVLDRVRFVLARTFGEAVSGTSDTHPPVLEYLQDGEWRRVPGGEAAVRDGVGTASFPAVRARGIRVSGGAPLEALRAYHGESIRGLAVTGGTGDIHVDTLRVLLRKEPALDGSPLPDLTASVYETDGDGLPSRSIWSAQMPESQVPHGEPTDVPAAGLVLREGERYALALGQATLAASREAGGYYRWVFGRKAAGEAAGVLADGEAKPPEHDWGTAWLRVSGEGAVTDLSSPSDHPGVRFGIPDLPQRYQTFRAPRKTSALADGVLDGGYEARDEELRIVSPRPVLGLYVYMQAPYPASVTVMDGAGTPLARMERFEGGIHWLPMPPGARPSSLRLNIEGSARIAEIAAV